MITKKKIYDNRDSEDVNSDLESDLYFAKIAVEYYGSAVRDNSITELISLGQAIESGEQE